MPRKTFVAGDVLTAADMNLLAQDGYVTKASLDTTAGEPGGAWATQAHTLANITLGGATSVCRSLTIGKTIYVTWYLTGGTPSITANAATTITLTGVTFGPQTQGFVYNGALGVPAYGRTTASSGIITIFVGLNQTNYTAGNVITSASLTGVFELA
jgi:hypothetical protein